MDKSKFNCNPIEELEKAYNRWVDLYTNGSCDPNWSDGDNLSIVRNHSKTR